MGPRQSELVTRSSTARANSWIVRVAIVCKLVFILGCGSKLPTLEGNVTLDGAPLADARVVFEAPDRATAFAKTDAEGNYQASTGSQTGIAAGRYGVAISAYQTKPGGSESPIPVLRTPKKFNSTETSGLTVEVQPGRNKDVNFALHTSDD